MPPRDPRPSAAALLVPLWLFPPLLATGCAGGEPTAAPAARVKAPAPVTVAQAEVADLPLDVEVIGHAEASSVVKVVSRVAGRLDSVEFQEGQPVDGGALLFKLDPRPFEIAVAEAKARLERDRVLWKNADRDAQRLAKLLTQDFAPRQQAEEAAAQAASLKAALQADRAAIDKAELELSWCEIRAPAAGRAGALLVHPGNLVSVASDNTLVEIRRLQPIYVRFAVPERYLAAIKARMGAAAGEPLEVRTTPRGDGAKASVGRLDLVDNEVDALSGTIGLRAVFDNADEALWPGQFLDVSLRLAVERDQVVVPTPAVQQGQQGTFVYVVKADATVELRPVDIGRHGEARTSILRGLAAGETVVTDGHLRLAPGAPVKVVTAQGDPAPPTTAQGGARP